jgi:uncharacterized membrane protein YpjA
MSMFGPLRRTIEIINGNRWLLFAILLINIAGSFFGLYYYWDQLAMTPWYLWIAVPDCPLYTFFMVIALTLILIGKPWNTFNAITAVGLSMYGTWTVLVLLYFGEFFFSPVYATGSWERLISHGGMALEGFLLLPYLTKTKLFSWAATALWFLALDSVDYFYQFAYAGLPMRTHPLAVVELYRLVSPAKVDMLPVITFGLSLIFFVAMVILSIAYGQGQQKRRSFKKEIRT